MLPQVLEEVLALKNQRAMELGDEEGINEGNVETRDKEAWEKDETVSRLLRS